FYLHNRVETIEEAAEKLQQLAPTLRFIIAHGQMRERDLEEKMHAFLRGDADVLVSTTIIESGLDIPQANTLVVERADALGLAQLGGERRGAVRPVRVDARVDASVPADYIGSEALKIDLHRRLALSESEDELRELQAATEDRYGPLPEPVENLFLIQEAKLK